MASSLDNHPTRDGFCVPSTDAEVLGVEEYYTLDDFAEEGDLQFEEDDIMVEVFGSDVYVDGVCADGNVGDCSFDAGTVSGDLDPKSSPCGYLGGSVEGLEKRPQGFASHPESITEESRVWVSEEGIVVTDRNAFSVSDLVWVKVEIYQWWPGQIADPSEDPSEKVADCSKRGLFLIAYFGDQSFSWHGASSLKPFIPFFSEAVMQPNSEVFWNAVDCALVEFSRQVQLGRACSCLPKNSHEKLICPSVDNGGTTKVVGVRGQVDGFASPRSFKPEKLLEYINLLARLPFGEVDQLDLAVTKVKLSCFYQRNGYERLPEVQYCRELMESDGGEGSNFLNSPPHRFRHDQNYSVDSIEEASPSQKKHRIQDPSNSSCIDDREKPISIAEDAGTSHFTDSLSRERSRNEECALLNEFEIFVSDMGNIQFPEGSLPDGLFEQIQFEATNSLEVQGEPSKTYQLEDANDSYWTDRIIETNSQDQNYCHGGTRIKDSRSLPKFDGDSLVVDENSPAELVLQFPEAGHFPSDSSLNKTLKMFGPLKESETRVDRKSRRARVVFRKFGDAKVAYSSAQKYSIFGPMAVKYQLNCPIFKGR